MRKFIFFLALFFSLKASAFDWALQITRKESKGDKTDHYFISEANVYSIKGPKNWVCMLKVDVVKTIEAEDSAVVLQNSFLGCKTPDNMLSTNASIRIFKQITLIDEVNLTLGLSNEIQMRLIPCIGTSRITCEQWKSQTGEEIK
jgi:hypothetical protein